jgi:hypothetical protein
MGCSTVLTATCRYGVSFGDMPYPGPALTDFTEQLVNFREDLPIISEVALHQAMTHILVKHVQSFARATLQSGCYNEKMLKR